MVLDHVAAMLLFSGPLFYVGLWMAIDPAGIAGLAELLGRIFRNVVQSLASPTSEEIVAPGPIRVSRRSRTALRFAGVALLLFAIVL